MKIIFDLKNFVKILIIITFIKIFFSFFYGDEFLDMEWKILYNNLVNGHGLTYYQINQIHIPSVYMPPLYIYFLYIFSFLNFSEFFTVKIILFVQCFLSGLSVYIFFKILKIFFNETYSYIIAFLYLLYPLNFYSSSQISSISLQIFLFIYFIYFFLNFFKKKNYLYFGGFSAFLCLLRGEFWLLFFICILFLFIKNFNQWKKIFCSFLTFVIILSPYLSRNYFIFDKLILTKSSGYNLWRGNSEKFDVNGDTDISKFANDLKKIEKNLEENNKLYLYELYVDNFYFDKAKNNIIENFHSYAKHYIIKFFSFAIFNYNSNYPNYFHPLIFIPELIISILAILGLVKNLLSKFRSEEILILTFFYLFIIPLFFVLPRYKLFILPMYFIFAFYYLKELFLKNNKAK